MSLTLKNIEELEAAIARLKSANPFQHHSFEQAKANLVSLLLPFSKELVAAARPLAEKATCMNCGGDGMVLASPDYDPMDGPRYGTCPKCRGTGLKDHP